MPRRTTPAVAARRRKSGCCGGCRILAVVMDPNVRHGKPWHLGHGTHHVHGQELGHALCEWGGAGVGVGARETFYANYNAS